MSPRALSACLLSAVLSGVAGLLPPAYAQSSSTDLLPRPSSALSCDDTPFGRRLTLGHDDEMLDLLDFTNNSSASRLHEWSLAGGTGSAPPFSASLNTSWRSVVGTGGTFLKAIRADLNGDGQDEVVVARGTTTYGGDHLTIDVLARTSNGALQLIDKWTLNQSFTGFDMAAGDLDGSQDGKQELALMLKNWNPAKVNVYVLDGSSTGGLASADNAWNGFWT
ncbi:MAG TPA: VCBS repeat-containing protein, partial [Rhodanobacteraceae bacterium]|nr:VCBS repeat-containing protein [Rhodanobacteraceae bacterium]